MRTTLKTKSVKHHSDEIKNRREAEILEAAAKLFAECGYSEADTQTLADRLGVGKGTIYRYFPSKRELFLAAVDRLIHQLHNSITAALNETQDPIDRIYNGIKTYLNFFAQRPEFVELMIQERAYFKDRDKPTYFEHQEQFACEWQEEFAGMVSSGRLRPIPFEQFHGIISDLLYGTMFTNYFARRQRAVAEQAEDIFDMVLHGILSDSEREKRRIIKAD
jgi:AcrR family transcriptional regulator